MSARSRLQFVRSSRLRRCSWSSSPAVRSPRSPGELDINAGTLGKWVQTRREDHLEPEPGSSPVDHGRLAALEEQNRAVEMENEFLR